MRASGGVNMERRTMGEIDEAAVEAALRRQQEDPDDHDISLIQECLRLSPEDRLRRLASWANFILAARTRMRAAKRSL